MEEPMRILALSDIHNEIKEAENILVHQTAYDLILITGDITTYGTPANIEEAIKRFQSHGKPVLAIAGNMDSPETDDTLIRMGCSINGKGVLVGDIGFFGTSAAPVSLLHTPYEISEEELFRRAETGWNDVKNARWKVFVPHAPPFNTKLDRILTGKHVGSTGIRTFVEKFQPNIVVCGHIHEARGTDTLGLSRMINCGPAAKGCYAIVEINETIALENCR